jgi:hypothetical protein
MIGHIIVHDFTFVEDEYTLSMALYYYLTSNDNTVMMEIQNAQNICEYQIINKLNQSRFRTTLQARFITVLLTLMHVHLTLSPTDLSTCTSDSETYGSLHMYI